MPKSIRLGKTDCAGLPARPEQPSQWPMLDLMGKHQRVQWLDNMPRMYLVLLNTTKLSKVDVQLCIPISNA